MSGPRAITGTDLSEIREAIRMLHIARGRLKGAGCPRAAAAVTRAIRSAQAGERHASLTAVHRIYLEGAAALREVEREKVQDCADCGGFPCACCPCGHTVDGGTCELANLPVWATGPEDGEA